MKDDHIGRFREKVREQSVQKPQILLSEIREYKLLSPQIILLKHVQDAESTTLFTKLYETRQAQKIFNKLDYLLRIVPKKYPNS